MARLASLWVLLLVSTPALAQPQLPEGHPPMQAPGPQGQQQAQPQAEQQGQRPPLGPAEAMQRIGEQRQQQQQQEMAQQQPPAQQPPAPQDVMHSVLSGQGPQIASAQASDEVPAGTIRVTVIDARDQLLEGVVVDVGVLVQGGDRNRTLEHTDAQGVALFQDMATGTGQAYRVNVRADGAAFSSTPFQLPPDRGFDVRITKLDTTSDGELVLQVLSRTFVQLQDERMHVVQMAKLLVRPVADAEGNPTDLRAYVFPEDGKLIRLPEGFTAFQSQPVMTDQRLTATDEGFRLEGSLTPGVTDLVWAYDLPIGGGDLEFEFPVPWKTFELRVESDAPPGMTLDVRGMPEAEPVESDSGRALLITAQRFGPSEAHPSVLQITIGGIPGPGPIRWVALGAALILLFGGFLLVRGGPGDRQFLAKARQVRQDELLEEAAELERSFQQSEVGPKFRARQMDKIIDELASLLHETATAKAAADLAAGNKKGRKSKSKSKSKPKPRAERRS